MFSKYREAGSIIYTSGVTSTGNSETQIRGCFEKLKGVLAEAGASMGDVLKVNVYLVDLNDREKYLNPIWREYFPSNPPARTTVQAGLSEPAKVEIEMVAERRQTNTP